MTTATATATMSDRTKDTAAAGYESELRAAARRCGLTMSELAAELGVTRGYLSLLASGRRRWTIRMRDKALAALGEAPGQGLVYRQKEVVSGESSYIRERARTLGMSMQDLAERVGGNSRLHVGGVPGPQEDGSKGPGTGRVSLGGSGDGRFCEASLR